MPASRTLHRHAALLSRMAESLGLDLSEALMQGVLAGEDWRNAVLRCTSCEDPEACLAWLAGFDSAAPLPTAPEMCRNAGLFDTLRRETVAGDGR
ncbi:DUF6455 family protein [Phaeovulum sp.]|uniref:DUF6455 family protein n=1 Tax=Phaeovulum sp. TaxID=2934796 RepID=UPI002731BB62|nr:DUF6455 family protein [Phaeovulum sp.]MDP1670192.1 DUF6455 family protein [Phaeovulum sp.]MDZ4120312.1 DUF6455 family protein [Phaeovulum sp.]